MKLNHKFREDLSQVLDEELPSLSDECSSLAGIPYEDYRRAAMCLFTKVGSEVEIDELNEKKVIIGHIEDSKGCNGFKLNVNKLPPFRDAESFMSEEGTNYRLKVYPRYIDSIICKLELSDLLRSSEDLTISKEK